MSDSGRFVRRDLDSLRLIALGRIPRCTGCPRYRALVAVKDRGAAPAFGLPAVPADCHYQVCAPLVARFDAAAALPTYDAGELRRSATRS